MSDEHKRRHRSRTGSTAARYGQLPLVAVDLARPAATGESGVATCAAVGVVAIALISLIWTVTVHEVQEHRTERRDRTEQVLLGQASMLAETITHEILVVDQGLTVLQSAWQQDSNSFDLGKWQQTMPALTSVASDIFIADEKHIIRQDILPQAVGQGVGAAYAASLNGALERLESDGTKNREAHLLAGQTGPEFEARQYLMYVVRPLDHPAGWLVGASYRSTELTKLFADAQLGASPFVALIDTRKGILQAVAGPASRRPHGNLSHTPFLELISRAPSGTWLGATPVDGVQRFHAFHVVPNRDMAIVVGVGATEALADDITPAAYANAVVATALVLAASGLLLWQFYNLRSNRRRLRLMSQNQTELERLRANDAANAARANLHAARLGALLDHTPDGLALFDSELRLVQWNHPFLRGIGIALHPDMPLDTMLRDQASRGLLGQPADIEAAIAQRVAILQAGDVAGVTHAGRDGEILHMRGLPIEEGGFILLLSGCGTGSSDASEDPVAGQPASAEPQEW